MHEGGGKTCFFASCAAFSLFLSSRICAALCSRLSLSCNDSKKPRQKYNTKGERM